MLETINYKREIGKVREIIKNSIILLLGIAFILTLSTLIVIQNKPIPVTYIEKDIFPNDYVGEFLITYYTHTGNNTSTGVYPKSKRTIAVDPKVIPYGTILYVEGEGYFIAEDCGGLIQGNRLDIFVDSQKEAIQRGAKQNVKVYIMKNTAEI